MRGCMPDPQAEVLSGSVHLSGFCLPALAASENVTVSFSCLNTQLSQLPPKLATVYASFAEPAKSARVRVLSRGVVESSASVEPVTCTEGMAWFGRASRACCTAAAVAAACKGIELGVGPSSPSPNTVAAAL